jgi:hypothetical protein
MTSYSVLKTIGSGYATNSPNKFSNSNQGWHLVLSGAIQPLPSGARKAYICMYPVLVQDLLDHGIKIPIRTRAGAS